jgi:hypothetical protein
MFFFKRVFFYLEGFKLVLLEYGLQFLAPYWEPSSPRFLSRRSGLDDQFLLRFMLAEH